MDWTILLMALADSTNFSMSRLLSAFRTICWHCSKSSKQSESRHTHVLRWGGTTCDGWAKNSRAQGLKIQEPKFKKHQKHCQKKQGPENAETMSSSSSLIVPSTSEALRAEVQSRRIQHPTCHSYHKSVISPSSSPTSPERAKLKWTYHLPVAYLFHNLKQYFFMTIFWSKHFFAKNLRQGSIVATADFKSP